MYGTTFTWAIKRGAWWITQREEGGQRREKGCVRVVNVFILVDVRLGTI